MKISFALLLIGGAGLLGSTAARAQVLPDSLKTCRSEPDNARRLQCYDREVDKYPLTVSQNFGLSPVQTNAVQKRRSGTPPKVQQLSAKISALRMRTPGVFAITLENGQVWQENGPDGADAIAVGDTVTIEPGLLGSFLLIGPRLHWSSKVHRLR